MTLTCETNLNTQPLKSHPIFNNWEVITKGWYIACKSKELKKQSVLSFKIGKQKLVIFRDNEGKVSAMDGFCPHMGVDLSIGKVVNNNLRCFFHHWEYNKKGQCVHIPAQTEIPEKARIQSYATEEKYGCIWIYPEADTQERVLEIPGLENQEVIYKIDPSYLRTCHHHITMINGIDPQHLKTVHNISIDMNLEILSNKSNQIEINLAGDFPQGNLKEKLAKFMLGNKYAYSMKYSDGCIGGLTIMKNVKLFNRFKIIPELHMIFAYQTKDRGSSQVTPIYIAKKRKGVLGKITSHICLMMTKILFKALQGEDGAVYENIRFNTETLLPIDKPVTKYIQYINKLETSLWSNKN